MTLFNQVSTKQTACGEEFFDPRQSLLGYLLAKRHEQLIISLKTQSDYPPLYMVATTYYTQNTLEQLTPYLADLQTLDIKPCSKADIEKRIRAENLKGSFLRDFIWYGTINISSGRVIKGHQSSDSVTLKSWPDIRLYKFVEYAKIATFMKINTAPLAVIAEYTQMPLAEVHNFYNACSLLGLIEKSTQQKIVKKEITQELSSVLAQIEARLAQKS